MHASTRTRIDDSAEHRQAMAPEARQGRWRCPIGAAASGALPRARRLSVRRASLIQPDARIDDGAEMSAIRLPTSTSIAENINMPITTG